jgi:hypothetical protein
VITYRVVAQIPFRSLKRIFDHSRVRFTANPKLAFQTQTLGLRPFRFTKNGYQKFFNVRSRDFGNNSLSIGMRLEVRGLREGDIIH